MTAQQRYSLRAVVWGIQFGACASSVLSMFGLDPIKVLSLTALTGLALGWLIDSHAPENDDRWNK